MKKIITAVAAAAVAMSALVGCMGVSSSNPEGWINDDTFRAQVTGYAPEGSERKWRSEAKEAAKIVGKETVMTKMIGSYIESTGATENNELIGKVVKEKAAGSIVGMDIVKVIEENEKEKSCTVIVEVSSPGLKKLMQDRIKQYFQEMKGKKVGGDAAK